MGDNQKDDDMLDVVVGASRLRADVLAASKELTVSRRNLKEMIERIREWMVQNKIRSVENIDGGGAVTLVESRRVPALTVDFIRACVDEFRASGGVFDGEAFSTFVANKRHEEAKTMQRVKFVNARTNNDATGPVNVISVASVDSRPGEPIQHHLGTFAL